MVKRKLLIDQLMPTDVDGLAAKVSALPIAVEVEGERKVFVFTMTGDERKLLSGDQLQAMAKTCGDVVHPAQAIFLVLPDGAKLDVYEVRD